MKRSIYYLIVSFLFIAGAWMESQGKSKSSGRMVEITNSYPISRNTCPDEFQKDISVWGTFNNTYVQKVERPILSEDCSVDNIPFKNKIVQLKVNPSSGSYLGGCGDEDYSVEISGADFGNGEDISNVTICGIEVCHIILQSSNLVVVYPDSGIPGTGDIVITSKSLGKTTLENAFTYQVPAPKEQAKSIQYSKLGDSSVDISWQRGTGEACVVFLKQANTGFFEPDNQTTYTASNEIDNNMQVGSTGWYCIYNDSGTSVSVTRLSPGAVYMAQVFEYNGQAGFESYLVSPATDNPKIHFPEHSISSSSLMKDY